MTTAQTRQIFAPSSVNQQPSLPRKDFFARLEIKLQFAYRAIKFIRYSIKKGLELLNVPFLNKQPKIKNKQVVNLFPVAQNLLTKQRGGVYLYLSLKKIFAGEGGSTIRMARKSDTSVPW